MWTRCANVPTSGARSDAEAGQGHEILRSHTRGAPFGHVQAKASAQSRDARSVALRQAADRARNMAERGVENDEADAGQLPRNYHIVGRPEMHPTIRWLQPRMLGCIDDR
ncbi:hypothetical protein GCM10010388_06500 [Streptomyces mauvecolor]